MSLDWFKFALNCDYVLTFLVSISVQTINEIGAFTSPNVLVDEVPELLAPCSRIRALSRITTLIGTSKSKATMEAEVIATIIGYTNAYC